jgi:hypothetical protein
MEEGMHRGGIEQDNGGIDKMRKMEEKERWRLS